MAAINIYSTAVRCRSTSVEAAGPEAGKGQVALRDIHTSGELLST